MAALTAALQVSCTQIPPQRVLPPPPAARGLVLVDIDGTLTTGVLQTRSVRPGAPQTLNWLTQADMTIAYITARSPLAQAGLAEWLAMEGFPAGPLHVAQNAQQRRDVADFKNGLISDYQRQGWRIAWAFGDSTSDFEAYAAAGIARTHVLAFRRAGAEFCQQGLYWDCLDDWYQARALLESRLDATEKF